MSRRSSRLNDKKCSFLNPLDKNNNKVLKFNIAYEFEEKEHVFSMTSDNEKEVDKHNNEVKVADKIDNYSESDSEDDGYSYYKLVINKPTKIPLIPPKQVNTDKISIEDELTVDDYVIV